MGLLLGETIELTSNNQVIEFVNIPQTGHTLMAFFNLGSDDSQIFIEINNNPTVRASNLYASGSSSDAYSVYRSSNFVATPGPSVSDLNRTVGTVEIGNYTSNSEYKPFTTRNGWIDSVSNNVIHYLNGEYEDNNAVTSVKFNGLFLSESIVSLCIMTD